MVEIYGNLIMHNVGQGLFFSGELRLGANKFNFIYDCGAERIKHLNRVVDKYMQERLSNSFIDLLIISHLHNDHTIGLRNILRNIRVDTVVLPYMIPAERLVLALKKIKLPTWYFEFLADPIEFLINQGVKKIIRGGVP